MLSFLFVAINERSRNFSKKYCNFAGLIKCRQKFTSESGYFSLAMCLAWHDSCENNNFID
jgi:hypothetical protein